MELYIRKITGKTINVYSNIDNPTILMVKNLIQEKENIPILSQRIIMAGKNQDDNKTINDYNWKRETCVFLIIRTN